MVKASVLVVDDEPSIRLSLKRALESKGYKVHCASNAKEASQAAGLNFDLAIVDLNLPDGNGTQLIEKLQNKNPSLQSILITGETNVSVNIVEAIKKDIFYFISKPFDIPVLLKLAEKAIKQKQLIEQNNWLKDNVKKQFSFDKIIGQSESICEITELMKKISKSFSTVLITGESGTGKELIARSIHCSTRSDAPFVSVNCGAIPKDLMESEFFGHMKGAFTGAVNERKGRFAMAEGGTLFLDEIGTMDLNLQVKLLRVLQEKEFEPVGSCTPVPFNARIIAATNINLEKAVAENKFRKDLFFRLNIIPLYIPSLKERREDIPLLAQHFIKIFNESTSSKLEGISEKAMKCLSSYDWPGNIREMENLIERLSVFKQNGMIEETDLPAKYISGLKKSHISKTVHIPDQGVDFNESVTHYENALLIKTLEKTNWNRKQAADLLNLNRTTLVEKLKKKGLKPPELD